MKHWFFILLLFNVNNAVANAPVHFDKQEQTALYDVLLEEIRCLVCQNQSLADSNAELAQDLRNEIASMIKEEKSETEIKAFLVARYGDFVLYRPPLQNNTWFLWIGPFVFLIVGFIVAIILIRRQSAARSTELQLTAEQEQALQQLNSENTS